MTRLPRVLLIAAHFPSRDRGRDGQGNYLLEVAQALHRTHGTRIAVLALRIGRQRAHETWEGIRVERVEPASSIPDLFSLYEPPFLAPAMKTLARHAPAAIRRVEADGPVLPAWCHGYETGAAASALSHMGRQVLGVIHYLVAQESLYDLQVADDPVRRSAYDSPLATAIGLACPRPFRPALVRGAVLAAPHTRRFPMMPMAIRQQLLKLEAEAALISNAGALLAVSPGLAECISRLYPASVGRLGHCMAGSPVDAHEEPGKAGHFWPWPQRDDRFRLALVGRPTGQKGWDYLASALHTMEACNPSTAGRLEVVMAGGLGSWGGPYSAWGKAVRRSLSALRRVAFHNMGMVSHSRVMGMLRAADCLLVPSVFEPFGLVIPEAMSVACLVMASDTDGPRALLRPPWGYLLRFSRPRDRVQEIHRGLLALLSLTRSELSRRGAMARMAARAFTWERCAMAHHEAMLGVMSGERPPRQ